MKKVLLPLFFLCCLSYGQGPSIALQSIEAVDKTEDHVEAEMLFQKLKELFVQSNRFRILDRESLGIVLNEQEIQKDINSINAEVVDQGRISGAEHIVGGKLTNLEYQEIEGIGKKITETLFGNNNASEEKLYRPVFTFSLNIISAETSETLHSATFDVGSLNLENLGAINKKEAFKKAINSLEDEITRDFINKFLPQNILILGIEEEENGAASVLLINTGDANGAEEKDKLKVYHISTLSVNDREIQREKEIAEIEIVDVEGDELSLAKVISGGNDILENFNAGETLICKSN